MSWPPWRRSRPEQPGPSDEPAAPPSDDLSSVPPSAATVDAGAVQPTVEDDLVHVVDDIDGFSAGDAPVMIHALDGFLSAGSAGRLAAEHLALGAGKVVASFEVDDLFDYRARRPALVFDQDHYTTYDQPRLVVRLLRDEAGQAYLLLSGPEPDYRWERFCVSVRSLIERLGVTLVVGMGAVPMGVPHTRPTVVTTHGTNKELLDRTNLWNGQLIVPSSAQALMEYRLGQWGFDAMGYVAHVPHYLTQVDYPTAAVSLLEAVATKTGLAFDLTALRVAAESSVADIQGQIAGQEAEEVVSGLEQQYDAFTRGSEESLLAGDETMPSAEELGRQVEQFLAGIERRDDKE